GAFHFRQQIIAQPSAQKRGQDAVDDDDDPEQQIGLLQRVVALAVKKLRNPDLNAAQRVGHHGHPQRCGQKGGILEKSERLNKKAARLLPLLHGVELPARRLFQKQYGDRQYEAGSSSNIERETPAVVGSKISAQQVAGCRSHGNRQVEHAKNSSADLLFEKIG